MESWNSPLFKYVNSIYFIIFIVCVLSIYLIGWIRCIYDIDLLNFSLSKNVDGWILVHILFYALIGYLYPYSIRLSFLLGCIWESFELWLGTTKPPILSGFGYCGVKKKQFWWYGRFDDIIANIIGLAIGRTLKLR